MILADEAPRGDFKQILVDETPADCDGVIAVSNSGVVASLGYVARAKLPFEHGLIRSHYVARTFKELISHKMSIDQTRKFIGADSLALPLNSSFDFALNLIGMAQTQSRETVALA
eukprot:Gb_16277 [translate_table: standard]